MKLPDQLARLAPEYRWLALSADLDTAHLIADAHKFFGRASSSRPRIVKRFGAARVELLASLASQVGHVYLSEATNPRWRYLIREPKQLQDLQSELTAFDIAWHSARSRNARTISFDVSSTTTGKLAAAERAFRLARQLEGPTGSAMISLGMLAAARGDHLTSARIYEDLIVRGESLLVRQCAASNAVIANLDAGRLDRCTALSETSVPMVLREIQAIYFLNRALFSLRIGSVNGTEGCLWSAATYSHGTRYWTNMLERVALARTQLETERFRRRDMDRLLTRFCEINPN